MQKIISLFIVLLFLGCVSQPSNQTNQTTPNVPATTQAVVPAENHVGKQVTVAPPQQSSGTARDVLVKASQNFKGAHVQVTYDDIEVFGKLKLTEAKSEKILAKDILTTSFGDTTTYYDGTTWLSCNTQRVESPFAQAGKVITKCEPSDSQTSFIDQADNLLSGEKDGLVLTFESAITSGKIIGRDCDQINIHVDASKIVGKTNWTNSDLTICFDRELGVPLYVKAIGASQLGSITIETQVKTLSMTVDESFFAIPKEVITPGCGMKNQACCSGNTCEVESMCTGGVCATCGTDGNPCCENNTCNYNEQCIQGTCHL